MPLIAPEPFETARFRVRLVARDDLPALLVVNGDEAVTQFLPYETWRSMIDAEAWLQRVEKSQATGTALQFVIAEKTTDQAIGTALIFRHDEGSARAELGYVLGRAHWGSGAMFEALHALINHAFAAMALRRLEAEVNPENAASIALLERLGFQREGLARERWVNKGVAIDVVTYGLLRREWGVVAS
jgi:[ribosomal protein S5]-alanine N-acetyltransferase